MAFITLYQGGHLRSEHIFWNSFICIIVSVYNQVHRIGRHSSQRTCKTLRSQLCFLATFRGWHLQLPQPE